MRNQLQNGIEHSKSSAQNRNEDNLALQLRATGPCQRGSDGEGLDGERAGCFIDNQCSYFAQHAAEFLRAGTFITQSGEIMLHQRVLDDGYFAQVQWK